MLLFLSRAHTLSLPLSRTERPHDDTAIVFVTFDHAAHPIHVCVPPRVILRQSARPARTPSRLAARRASGTATCTRSVVNLPPCSWVTQWACKTSGRLSSLESDSGTLNTHAAQLTGFRCPSEPSHASQCSPRHFGFARQQAGPVRCLPPARAGTAAASRARAQ